VRAADAAAAAPAYRADMQNATTVQRRRGQIHWNQDYADVALGLAITIFALVNAARGEVRMDVLSVPLLLLQTLPIIWRRKSPMLVILVVGSAITVYSLLGYNDSSAGLGIFVAFYTVAANMPRRRATIAAAITAVGIFISFASYAALNSMSGWTSNMTITYFSFGIAWLIGDNLRVRRAYTRQLEERASELEHEKEEKAAQAVTEERARIARELHDVVAHYVSVMVVQAAAARRVVDKDPAAAKGALEAVETAGRTALAEMRRMLEVLRTDDPGMGPQPGLGEIERLIATVREAGLPVEFSIKGEACCLPAGMDLAAYRIIQEALTNTVKHGGKAAATVAIHYTENTLEIEVVDDGRGAAAPLLSGIDGSGHGLIGMKERVALFGGVLEVGPVLTGGYRVLARMPIEVDDIARAKAERAATQASVDDAAARERREHVHKPAARAHSPAKPHSIPPLMIRVVPPHPTEQSRPLGRREQEGHL
jgi:signal transduction histidine kinase